MLNLYAVSVVTESCVKYYDIVAESTKEAIGDAKYFYYEECNDGYEPIIGTIVKLVSTDL